MSDTPLDLRFHPSRIEQVYHEGMDQVSGVTRYSTVEAGIQAFRDVASYASRRGLMPRLILKATIPGPATLTIDWDYK